MGEASSRCRGFGACNRVPIRTQCAGAENRLCSAQGSVTTLFPLNSRFSMATVQLLPFPAGVERLGTPAHCAPLFVIIDRRMALPKLWCALCMRYRISNDIRSTEIGAQVCAANQVPIRNLLEILPTHSSSTRRIFRIAQRMRSSSNCFKWSGVPGSFCAREKHRKLV